MLDAGDGMRVRGRAHTGLVREEAAGHAELHRLGDRQAERAAHDGLGIKGRDEDEPEGGNHFGDVGADHPEAADEVDGRHEGNDLLGDARQTADAAEEDEAREHRAHDARDGGRHVEGGLHGVRDGVGLHHVADAAQRNDDCDREEDRKRTPLLAHAERDVVGGTAEHAALLVLRAIGLQASTASAKMVAMPKKAATQSQKSEPGPPATRAVAVPATLPVPTWAATAVASA